MSSSDPLLPCAASPPKLAQETNSPRIATSTSAGSKRLLGYFFCIVAPSLESRTCAAKEGPYSRNTCNRAGLGLGGGRSGPGGTILLASEDGSPLLVHVLPALSNHRTAPSEITR